VLWIRIHFFGFGSTNFFYSDSDPYTNILTRIFLKWCLIAFMCSGICTTEKKVFQLKNLRVFFSFKCLICDFLRNFYFTTVSGSESKSEPFFRIRIQPKNSDYFGFGSTALVVILKKFCCWTKPYVNESRDAPDSDLVGYPAYPKAGFRISGKNGYQIFGSKFKCILNYEIDREIRFHESFRF
jgi:hypothetical protein